jgi:hypothetical protein
MLWFYKKGVDMVSQSGGNTGGGEEGPEVPTTAIVRYLESTYLEAGVEVDRIIVTRIAEHVYAVKLLRKGEPEDEAFFLEIGEPGS